jgi:hypothetical protein
MNREWQFAVGYGGWYRADHAMLPGPLYLRISRQGDGRYQVTELYLDGRGEPLAAGLLRDIPLARLESSLHDRSANPSYGVDMAEAFPDRPGVDLSVLASYFYASADYDFGDATHWVAQSLREAGQVPHADPPPTSRRKRTAPLSIPEDGRLSASFLGRVAEEYTAAVAAGDSKPAVTLADQAGVAPNTVRRWVYLARKAGKLPPGRQGRIG